MMPWSRTSAISTRRAKIADCGALAEIHVTSFKRGWSDSEFEALLVQPGVYAVLAERRGRFGARAAAGFVLYRATIDEAEILSVAVAPEFRRRGVGRMLVEEALRHLYRVGAQTLHLEVEDGNHAAIRLYRRLEFRESGRRPAYFAQGRDKPAGALVMARQLR
jgi:ribosomal-protein-alanine N-acetyltransferase